MKIALLLGLTLPIACTSDATGPEGALELALSRARPMVDVVNRLKSRKNKGKRAVPACSFRSRVPRITGDDQPMRPAVEVRGGKTAGPMDGLRYRTSAKYAPIRSIAQAGKYPARRGGMTSGSRSAS